MNTFIALNPVYEAFAGNPSRFTGLATKKCNRFMAKVASPYNNDNEINNNFQV